jgi:hypothetical protein
VHCHSAMTILEMSDLRPSGEDLTRTCSFVQNWSNATDAKMVYNDIRNDLRRHLTFGAAHAEENRRRHPVSNAQKGGDGLPRGRAGVVRHDPQAADGRPRACKRPDRRRSPSSVHRRVDCARAVDADRSGRVPSGSLRVTAEVSPNEAGEAMVALRPGAAGSASIVLQSSKEVTEETPLVVAEADGGMLSASARALTLKFVGVRGTVRIRTIDEISLLGNEGNSEVDLTRMFKVEGGAIVATDPTTAIATIRARRNGLVRRSSRVFVRPYCRR